MNETMVSGGDENQSRLKIGGTVSCDPAREDQFITLSQVTQQLFPT